MHPIPFQNGVLKQRIMITCARRGLGFVMPQDSTIQSMIDSFAQNLTLRLWRIFVLLQIFICKLLDIQKQNRSGSILMIASKFLCIWNLKKQTELLHCGFYWQLQKIRKLVFWTSTVSLYRESARKGLTLFQKNILQIPQTRISLQKYCSDKQSLLVLSFLSE